MLLSFVISLTFKLLEEEKIGIEKEEPKLISKTSRQSHSGKNLSRRTSFSINPPQENLTGDVQSTKSTIKPLESASKTCENDRNGLAQSPYITISPHHAENEDDFSSHRRESSLESPIQSSNADNLLVNDARSRAISMPRLYSSINEVSH